MRLRPVQAWLDGHPGAQPEGLQQFFEHKSGPMAIKKRPSTGGAPQALFAAVQVQIAKVFLLDGGVGAIIV